MINVFSLILSLYRADIDDFIKMLTTLMQQLDAECTLSIYREDTLIYAFFIIIIEDMPQQTDNEEFLHYSVKINC